MNAKYEVWLTEVRAALESINMPLEDWQKVWTFDFEREHRAGTRPEDAADKANRFWWYRQNVSLGKECRLTRNCWLPRGHQGDCQPVS